MGYRKREIKLDIDITISRLDKMIAIFFIGEDRIVVPLKLTIKMRKFLNLINRTRYENDLQMMVRFSLLDRICKGILLEDITNVEELSDFCNTDSKYGEEIADIFDEGILYLELDDINSIDLYISERLTYSYLYKYQSSFTNLFDDLDMNNFEDLGEINNRFTDLIEKASNDIKLSKKITKESTGDFGNDDDTLKQVLSRTIQGLNSSSGVISTGIKWLNRLLGGEGYMGGKVYLWMGVYKGWKSGLLLNSVLWARQYNMNMKPKTKGMRPCILYVTMENSSEETLERIWSYYIGEDDDLKNYDRNIEGAYQKLKQAGFNTNEGPYIEIKYRTSKSINTSELDDMIDDLAERGLEVVMLVQDYIKRIKPKERDQNDLRLELGAIIDDYCSIAKTRQIVIVTANQLNREAVRILEEKGANAFKKLGGSQAGESLLPMENADWAGILSKTKLESTGLEYVNLKEVARRFQKKNEIMSFSHPMENGMKLQEDLDLTKSKSILNLGDGLTDYDSSVPKEKNKDFNPDESEPTPRKNKRRQPKPSSISYDDMNEFIMEDE